MSDKKDAKLAGKTVIKVENIAKTFHLPKEHSNELKQIAVNFFKRKKGYTDLNVLRDISFEIKKGDFFGIVGRNGSGKSTLLKILAGIYQPTKGKIESHGKIVPFIELGVGFNPELTGRENIYMNGAMLGFSNSEVREMYDEIVEFAELEDFMDQKLKNYSSGMQVRLAFSIAIKAQGDILILDEVLAVGDEAFQRKCFNYFAELKRDKKTVILVTHSMDSVQQFCNRAIMIEKGKIIESGNVQKVSQKYRELFMKKSEIGKKEEDGKVSNKDIVAKVDCKEEKDKIKFDIEISSKNEINDDLAITFILQRDTGEMIYRWVSDEKIREKIKFAKNKKMKIKLEIKNIFPNGKFSVQLGVKKVDRSFDYAIFNNIAEFEIINKGSFSGDIYWKPEDEFSYEN